MVQYVFFLGQQFSSISDPWYTETQQPGNLLVTTKLALWDKSWVHDARCNCSLNTVTCGESLREYSRQSCHLNLSLSKNLHQFTYVRRFCPNSSSNATAECMIWQGGWWWRKTLLLNTGNWLKGSQMSHEFPRKRWKICRGKNEIPPQRTLIISECSY